jgi:hypothetical protein
LCLVPSCTNIADVALTGEIFRIAYDLDVDAGRILMERLPESVFEQYVLARSGVTWGDVLEVQSPGFAPAFLLRLFNLDIFDELVPFLDTKHGLRDKGVRIAVQPYWNNRWLPLLCFPDGQGICSELDAAVGEEESRRIRSLKESGYELWTYNWVTYQQDGAYASVDGTPRPHFSLSDGMLASPLVSGRLTGLDIGETLASNMREFASEIGPDYPVITVVPGLPIEAVTTDGSREAAACPSDFSLAYEHVESWFSAALESLTPEQFHGFASALFEGSHFDIHQPDEEYSFPLNRAGETGYNHPALNMWLAQ